MKLKTTREILLHPLQQIVGVVERRQTLPILSNVLLVAEPGKLELTTTDLEVQLVGRAAPDVLDAGRATIPARKLMDICRALPDEAGIELNVKDERATLKAGRSRFTLATLPADDYPKLESPADAQCFDISQVTLKRLIEQTQFAMAQQDVRYYLNGLMLEVAEGCIRTVATDGHRLAMCEADNKTAVTETLQVIVPRKGVVELGRLLETSDENVRVCLGKNHLHVTLPDIALTSKLIDGRFPDYHRVIPRAGDKELVADRVALREALARISILSNEKYKGVRLQFSGNSLKLSANNPDQEEAEEELEVNFSGGDLEIGFNVRYLLDALAAVDSDEVNVSLTDSNSSCLIQAAAATGSSSQCRYVVMPMRL